MSAPGTATPRARIATFNPYEALHPGHAVVTHEALLVAKHLRAAGVEVVFDQGRRGRTDYLVQKGIFDYLYDHIVVQALESVTPGAVAGGVLKSAIVEAIKGAWKQLRMQQDKPTLEPKNIYVLDGAGVQITNWDGSEVLGLDALRQAQADVRVIAARFEMAVRRTRSPSPRFRPTPLFLRHTPQIVGWGRMDFDSRAMRVRDVKVTDPGVIALLDQRVLRGLSVGGIGTELRCSICDSDYILCDHIAGHTYSGRECLNRINKAICAEISLVDEPVNASCLVDLGNRMKWSELGY